MTKNKFNQIKTEYDDFYKSLMKEGKMPLRDTGIGFWGPSVSDEIYETFKKLKLKNKKFLDLGSGDGKVALIASLFCKQAHGIEFDRELHTNAAKIQGNLKIKNTTFFNGDFMKHDISKYDTIFCSPDKPMERGLEDKLKKELKGNLILYGHHFHPRNLKKKKSFKINDTLVTVYR
jgi:16S rRNA G966 N2-methylase RsmD